MLPLPPISHLMMDFGGPWPSQSTESPQDTSTPFPKQSTNHGACATCMGHKGPPASLGVCCNLPHGRAADHSQKWAPGSFRTWAWADGVFCAQVYRELWGPDSQLAQGAVAREMAQRGGREDIASL